MHKTIIELNGGSVRGERCDGICVFKGIPFAAPPVGELRFAAPQPPRPWAGVRDATRFAEPSVQMPRSVDDSAAATDVAVTIGAEDCLYLNIYTPLEPGPHPVLVWVHSGGAVEGSPSECDGASFAQHGVVVVTIAYRLGALGLLYLPGVFEDQADCNFALLDQIAALRWVQENIAAFDGDSRRVTLAGLSNGGRTVGNLLAAPSARGLFQQAVSMSGTGVGYLVAKPDDAHRLTAAVLSELGLDMSTARQLRSIPAERIVAAQTRVSSSWPTLIPFQVVVDGTVMPERPIDAIARGVARDIAIIVGNTHDEYDYFHMGEGRWRRYGYRAMVVDASQLEQATAAYRRLLPADWSEEEVRRHAVTSADWWMPAIRLAEANIKAGGQAWVYRLDWRLAPRGHGFGAPHGLDVPLMSPNDPEYESVMLAAARRDTSGLTTAIDAMRAALIRFIDGGDPGVGDWPAYDIAARPTFLFDELSAVAEDPERELRLAWEQII
ncbi:MAG TPA: carboxylesterase family protein [Solirubrobacteraceae bacterium]|jgi:para-nitrobenzyl esterase|nr:carboxylesterase family protein [Solirubrobacteraceae bacterium]